ncbi:MAG: hypothetical protein OEQ39_02735 [Gammaproteobacteria bacterium]|nr:hypothetical protein [Gammaproteobacteria bacterium]MDH3466065.1 hypothetical protein [Gammaproteobacteria bacterium]
MNNVVNVIDTAADMVNLARYPIADLDTAEGAAFAKQCRREYLETGLCMLPDFIVPGARQILAEEASAISSEAYFCKSTHNAYLTEDNPEWSVQDVAKRQEQTYVGSVAYDRIPDDAYLRRLYLWDPLKDFIGSVLGKSEFYRFADPLGACSINVFVDGGEHGWHFDESEFTVTLMLQAPTSGGAFEYVPKIRGRANEKEIVAAVLDGNRNGVVELPFTAGTLLIFGGQQTIHRVTRVSGRRARLVPVLCYSEQPDLKNSESVRMLFWGRTGNEAGLRA